MSLKERLEELRQQGLEEIKQSDDLDRVNDVRVKLLGKKGPLTSVLRG
ncbi:MAG: phenylalanine--tRNA ligase subunit alpha, partial [Limosilactobacillus fermentum]